MTHITCRVVGLLNNGVAARPAAHVAVKDLTIHVASPINAEKEVARGASAGAGAIKAN